jgi:hypothetical protein
MTNVKVMIPLVFPQRSFNHLLGQPCVEERETPKHSEDCRIEREVAMYPGNHSTAIASVSRWQLGPVYKQSWSIPVLKGSPCACVAGISN